MNVKYYSILLCIVFICFKCDFRKNNVVELNFGGKNVIATIDNLEIEANTIDSLLSDQIYALKLSTVDDYLADILIRKESEKYNLPYDMFFKEWVLDKIKITDEEIIRFLKSNPSLLNDSVKGELYLRQIKSKNKRREFVDSVSQYYTIKKYLRPDYFETINDQRIFGFQLTEFKGNRINVFIISNPHCPGCNEVFSEFKRIVDKYNNKANFQFVYLDGYYNDDAMAFTAANKQGRFAELYNLIHENNIVYLDSLNYLFYLANKSGVNMVAFEKDFNNGVDLNNLLRTRDYLFENKIFETPVFIVNNLVLKEPHAINFLENVILEEIGKY